MMFLFKKKEIVVDCFTHEPAIYDVSKVDYSKKFFPDWWKKLPTKYPKIVPNSLGLEIEHSTIRRCPGVNDIFKHGVMIPMWSDLKVKVLNDKWSYNYSFQPEMCDIQTHPVDQYGPAFDGYNHLKLLSPWVFKEKTGVKFAWLQPSWNLVPHLNQFSIVPAVVDYKFQNATHINMFVPKGDYEFTINCGEPIIHVIPLTEKKLVIKTHLITALEWSRMMNTKGSPVTFINKNKYFRDKITKQESEQKKCPFGFGK
jgi:hypothetical protein